MYIKNKKGQSTVEYVLLMTAVVAVIIAFVTSKGNGGFQDQLGNNLNSATQEMGSLTDRYTASHAAAPSGTNSVPVYNVDINP
jgi:hypothetical protein